jgi:hypothetical protein
MITMSRQWQLYASHRQFYLEDGVNPGDPGHWGFWSDEALTDRLAMGPRIIGIGTGSYGMVTIVFELHDGEPELDPTSWDHVVEGSIELPSGELRIAGCLDGAWMVIAVPAGEYRVRCCQTGLAGAVEWGEGPDRYVVQAWGAALAPRSVLRRWAEEI